MEYKDFLLIGRYLWERKTENKIFFVQSIHTFLWTISLDPLKLILRRLNTYLCCFLKKDFWLYLLISLLGFAKRIF